MIDKGLYKRGRVGLKGGADASQFGRPSSQQQTVNVGAGGATLGNTPLTTYSPPSGGDGGNDGNPFRKTPPKKKTPVKTFLTRGADYARKNPLQVLLGFLNPVFGGAMLGANFLNDPERRKRLTGYETQEEYDEARQNRINLNRIKTIENTLARKYADGDYSQTNLDERLAALKSQMGITPNTAADLRPDLDFSNQSELAFEGIGSLDSPASGFVAAKGPDFSSLLNQNQKRNTLANVEFNRMGSYLDGVTDRELYGNFNTIKPTNLNDFEGLYSLPEKKDFLGNTSEDYQISPNNINAYQAKSDIAPQFQDLVRRVGINETQKKMIDSAVNMYGKVNPDQKIDATTQQEIFDSVKKFDTKAKDKTLGLFGGQEADPMTKQEYQDYLISQGYI